jgi:hypothetical protein
VEAARRIQIREGVQAQPKFEGRHRKRLSPLAHEPAVDPLHPRLQEVVRPCLKLIQPLAE